MTLAYHVWVLVALVLALAAAVFDWTTGKIPDQLTLGALAGAPILHAVAALQVSPSPGSALAEAGASLAGAALASVLPLLLMRAGAMGGGDVKLFVALGAVAGPGFIAHAQTYAFMVAMVHGLAVVARKKADRSTFRNAATLFARPLRKNTAAPAIEAMTPIRLAPSVLLGSCVAGALLWQTPY